MDTRSTSPSPRSAPLSCPMIDGVGRSMLSRDPCRRLAGGACRYGGRRIRRRWAPREDDQALGADRKVGCVRRGGWLWPPIVWV
eukprot:1188474-Prorocentrum_minimum.AAC.1